MFLPRAPACGLSAHLERWGSSGPEIRPRMCDRKGEAMAPAAPGSPVLALMFQAKKQDRLPRVQMVTFLMVWP